ncbi:MAG: hypothetical protein GX556_19805 [Fibrobacter sp.]|nr:hypothetical protein [Fibrobacter sp.]
MQEQCRGITRSGERCKISGNLKDGYCHLHVNQAPAVERVVEKGSKPEIAPEISAVGPAQNSKLRGVISLILVFAAGVFLLSISRKKPSSR